MVPSMCYLKAQVVPSMLMRTGVSRETPVSIKLLASIIADSVRMLTGASREAPVNIKLLACIIAGGVLFIYVIPQTEPAR
jgi:uncharacterized membrane protein YfcA